MKHIKKNLLSILLLLVVILGASYSFARISGWCIGGRTWWVYTYDNGYQTVYEGGGCNGTGRVYIKITNPSGGSSSIQIDAPQNIYDLLNATVLEPTSNFPEELNKEVEKSPIDELVYSVDPFRLNTEVAEKIAQSDDLSLYGMKIMGNPVENGTLVFVLLSDKDQTVSAKITGLYGNTIYAGNITVKRGSNDVSIHLNNYLSGLANITLVSDKNSISKQITLK